MDNYMKNREGFTLLEVLLAIVILSILIVPVFNFFTQSMYYTKSNQQYTIAAYAARNALIFIEKQPFTLFNDFLENCTTCDDQIEFYSLCTNNPDLFQISDDDSPDSICGAYFKPTFNNVVYTITGTIEIHDDSDYQNYLIPITVQANWVDVRKENTTNFLKGFIADEGIRYKPN